MAFVDFGYVAEFTKVEYRPGVPLHALKAMGVDPAGDLHGYRPEVWVRYGENALLVRMFMEDVESLIQGLAEAMAEHVAQVQAGTSFDPKAGL
ncbi:hypothetical protein ACFRAQ_02725 [Nocardia sp. NPDC056611]|uniref:hypothetical protein n=1 Tax=Nocardia sp. NPDC056611 TaxID=3345877 RepID=UPI00366B6093